MRKTFATIFYILMVLATVCAGVERLANHSKRGLNARTMQDVLKMRPEQVDLGTAVLIASEQWSDTVQGITLLSELDRMAYEIRRRLEAKGLEANYQAIAVINDYLYNEIGFKAVKKITDPEDLFLHRVLEKKTGYCLSLSVLYLSIGERLGLQLYGVVVPGHFFVRYDDGKTRFNIETTAGGASKRDEDYLRDSNSAAGPDTIYMKNLNKLGTMSCFFNNLGNVYSEAGKIDTAREVLETAVELNPTLGEAQTNLGNVYLKLKRTNDAIRQYRQALEINPNDSKTHSNLGNAFSEKGWYSDAVTEYKKSVELDPNFAEGYRNLAIAYFHQDKYSEAGEQLSVAIRLKPEEADNYVLMGEIYYNQGQVEQAKFYYRKALTMNSNIAEAYYGLGMCYGKEGQTEEQKAVFDKAVSLKPDLVAAVVGLGNIYFAKEEYLKAIGYYSKASAVSPGNGDILYNLGSAYLNNGDDVKATEAYIQALAGNNNSGAVHKGLTYAYYRQGKYEQASKHLQKASELGEKVDENLRRAIQIQLKRP